MAKTSMKKIMLLIARKDVESVMRELILFGYLEVSEPDSLLENPELAALVKHEIVDLDGSDANVSSVAMLGTRYTLLLTGWVPARYEPSLLIILSNYLCAWELDFLSPEELDFAPVMQRWPKFLGKLRLAGRKQFTPLKRKSS